MSPVKSLLILRRTRRLLSAIGVSAVASVIALETSATVAGNPLTPNAVAEGVASLGSGGVVPAPPDPVDSARALFRRLEPVVANRPELLAGHRAALAGYPLLPYLEAAVLEARFPKVDERVLGDFLLRHDGAPFAENLREDWLHRLASKNDGAGFLLYYRPSKNTVLRCHYLRYALAGGSNPTILPGFVDIWLTAKPLPGACSPVEKLWVAAGERSSERIWQRLELAVNSNETATIMSLRPLLPTAERPLVELWLRLRKQPLDVGKANLFAVNSPEIWRLKAWALSRAAWGDRDEALAVWDRVAIDPAFLLHWREQAGRCFALALASAGHPAASRFLAAVPARLTDERIASARIVDALRRLDWGATDYWLNQLSASDLQTSRWRYFNARRLKAQDRNDSAIAGWQALAANLDYYGFLARGQLGQQNRVSPPPLAVAAETVARIRALPAMQRAKEWLALDRQLPARREWYALSQILSPVELHAAAVVANDWNWPDRAIAAMGKAPATGAWELRFPLAHADTLTNEARHRQIHPSWAIAITRQESMFVTDAKSSAGALGLMQLMPATAKQTARKYRISYSGSHDLIRPTQNIRIGVAHLAELIDLNDGNFVYATAAYNAGQSRVDRWREQFADLPLDIWIETIPFKETQNYVKNVMAYSLIYAERLGQDRQVFDLLSASARAPLLSMPPLAGPPAL